MRSSSLLSLIIVCAGIGMLVCAYRRGWIIIAYPSATLSRTSHQPAAYKKDVTLFVWRRNNWYSETATLLWSPDTATTMHRLINRWLTLLEDEHIITTPTLVQSVIMTPSGSTGYISFDHSPLPQQASTYTKISIIESLAKTIRENALPVQDIYLLVHHEPLRDDHLDFSHPWPISSSIQLHDV